MKSNYFSSTLSFYLKLLTIKSLSRRLVLISFFLLLLITGALGQDRVYPITNFPHPSEAVDAINSKGVSGLSYEKFKSLYYDINPALFINSDGSISDATEGLNAKVVNVDVGTLNSLQLIQKNTSDVELLIVNYSTRISSDLLKSFPKLKLIVVRSKAVSNVLNNENVKALFDITIWSENPDLNVVYKNAEREG